MSERAGHVPPWHTGYAELDEEHASFLERALTITEGCEEPDRMLVPLHEVLEFLSDHVAQHFSQEEGRMASSSYPELDSHRQDHDLLRLALGNLSRQLEQHGPTPELALAVRDIAANALVTHIRVFDAKMARHLVGAR